MSCCYLQHSSNNFSGLSRSNPLLKSWACEVVSSSLIVAIVISNAVRESLSWIMGEKWRKWERILKEIADM